MGHAEELAVHVHHHLSIFVSFRIPTKVFRFSHSGTARTSSPEPCCRRPSGSARESAAGRSRPGARQPPGRRRPRSESSTSRAVETARDTAVQSSSVTPPSLSTKSRSVCRPPPPPISTSTSSSPPARQAAQASWRTFSRISSLRPILQCSGLRPPPGARESLAPPGSGKMKKWATPDPLSGSAPKMWAGINRPTRDSQTEAEATVFLAAAVQMRSGNDRAANEARALSLLGRQPTARRG